MPILIIARLCYLFEITTVNPKMKTAIFSTVFSDSNPIQKPERAEIQPTRAENKGVI